MVERSLTVKTISVPASSITSAPRSIGITRSEVPAPIDAELRPVAGAFA